MGFKWCKNEYEIFTKNVAGIIDKNKNVAYIDVEDLPKIYNYMFTKDSKGYFKTGTSNMKYIPLHYLILGGYDSTKYVVDHINRCKLDNQKCNLMLVTQRQNSLNRGLRKNNTTGYNGVSYDKTRKKYTATYSKKKIGRFNKLEDAIKAREDYERGQKFFNIM